MDINIFPTTNTKWVSGASCTAKSTSVNGSFQAQMESAKQPSSNYDQVELSKGSYEDRLEMLKKLHAETDYSGMGISEKGKLIEDRFQEAFPELRAIMVGLFHYGTNDIYDQIAEEFVQQVGDVFGNQYHSKESINLRKEWRGYGGLSDSEIIAKIHEKYSGGTMVDRANALGELYDLKLDNGTAGLLVNQMQSEMIAATEGRYGQLDRNHPVRVSAMQEMTGGTQMNWTQLMRATMATESARTYYTAGESPIETTGKYLAELQSKLDTLLDQLLGIKKGGE